MKKIDLNINKFCKKDVESVADVILSGRVAVIPTDTIYGLSALASDKKAVNNIYKIKKRDRDKPLLLLMKSFCMIRKYCYLNKRQYNYIKENIGRARALTIILKSKNTPLKYLANNTGGLSVRIPQGSKFLMQLIKKINEPLVSTSLNLSGKNNILDLKNLTREMDIKKIDFILDIGKIKMVKVSKIIDICDVNSPKIIRK